MADYNSSLPVRTETNGDVVAKLVDFTTNTQGLSIDASGRVSSKLFDGAGNSVTSQVNGTQRALDIGINVAGVQIDPRQVRALTSADVVTVDQGTDPWNENIAQIAGAVPSATNALPSRLTDGTAYYDARQIRALTSSDVVTANIKDSSGASFSSSNPLPVNVVDAVAGDEVLDFKQAVAVAAAASDTHTYTVTALKTLHLQQVVASGSGKMKCEIKIAGSLVAVLFNSTAEPNVSYEFKSPQNIAAGVAIAVVLTNLDKQAQDLYSTIEGYEV